MTRVEVAGATVRRGERRLLDGVTVTAGARERLVLLGPSGSGKTTLLRAVAGLEELDAGHISFDGRDVTDLPARDRDVAFVDQRASLQPHLDVRANLAFPLRLRRVPRPEVARRVEAEARAFSLKPLLGRLPRTLAAGERHEAAVARSLVRRSAVLLLDEPFARVDAHRRSGLAREVVALQEGYGLTLLLATNDQRTALAVAHRIVVLQDGRVEQIGPPEEVHDHPATSFVAGFLGSPPMNLLPAVVVRHGRGALLSGEGWELTTSRGKVADLAGRRVLAGVRPEALVSTSRAGPRTLAGTVRHREFLGPEVVVTVACGTSEAALLARIERPGPDVGDPVRLVVERGALHLFDAAGAALVHDL